MSILVSQIWLHVHHILVSERSTWGSLPTIQEPVAKRRAPCWMPLQFVPRAARRSPLHGRVQSLYHSFDLKNTAKWLLTFQHLSTSRPMPGISTIAKTRSNGLCQFTGSHLLCHEGLESRPQGWDDWVWTEWLLRCARAAFYRNAHLGQGIVSGLGAKDATRSKGHRY